MMCQAWTTATTYADMFAMLMCVTVRLFAVVATSRMMCAVFCGGIMTISTIIAQAQIVPPNMPSTIATIRTPDKTARIGDTILVPVTVAPNFRPDSEFVRSVRGFRLRMTVNPTVAAFRSELMRLGRGTQENANASVETGVLIRGTVVPELFFNSRLPSAGDTIALIPFVVCLGDAQSTLLAVSTFQWLDSLRNEVLTTRANTVLRLDQFGTLTVQNARWYNLVNTNPWELFLEIAPNPVVFGTTVIQIMISEAGRRQIEMLMPRPTVRLELFDQAGRLIILPSRSLTERISSRFLMDGKDEIVLTQLDRTVLQLFRTLYCRFSVGAYSVTKILRL